MRRPSLVALLVPSLFAPGIALADTFTVGTTGDYDDLASAIAAANQLGVPSEIVIDSATYQHDAGTPTPRIEVPLTIRSTLGSGATRISSLWAIQPLVVQGLTIEAGMVTTPNEGTFFASPITTREARTGTAPSVVATDIVLRDETDAWDGPAVSVQRGYANFDQFDVSDFHNATAFEFLGQGVEFDLSNGTIAHCGNNGGSAGAISAPGLLHGSVTNVTFIDDGWDDTNVYFEGGSLEIADSSFEGGEGSSIHVRTTREAWLTVTNTKFSGRESDHEGQIFLDYLSEQYFSRTFPIHADLSGVTFENNVSLYGAADLTSVNDLTELTVTDSSILNPHNYYEGHGSFAGIGDWVLSNVSFTGDSETYAPNGGGAIYFAGSNLYCADCDFSTFGALYGGAVLIEGSDSMFYQTSARFERGSFTDTWADWYGGAIGAGQGVDLRIDGTSFEHLQASGGGAITGYTYMGLGYGSPAPQHIHLSHVTSTDTEAAVGGFLFVAGLGTSVTIEDSQIADSRARFGDSGFDGGEAFVLTGSGGVISAQLPLGDLTVRRTSFSDTSARRYGGVLFSGSSEFSKGIQPNRAPGASGPVLSTVCQRADSPYLDEGLHGGIGASITFDGVTVDGATAKYASVGFFAPYDEVRIAGSDFTGNSAELDATFLGYGVSRFDLSCNTFCGNSVSGHGSGVYLFDPGNATGLPHFLDYSVKNNEFVGNQDGGDGEVVGFNFCDDEDGNRSDVLSEASVSRARLDSGGAGPNAPRGQLAVWNNTFTGDTDAPASRDLWGQSRDVRLSLGNNLFQSSVAAVDLEFSYFVDGDFNLYDDVLVQADHDASLYLPGPNDVTATPAYFAFTPGTCDFRLFLTPGSPGVDQGDFHVLDRDGTVSDIGAFGGPGACPADRDNDGYDELVDCNDDDRNTYPGATETPYDTIDQDCDGVDFCDADHDGFDSDFCPGGTDCDDGNANVHPGAADLYANGIDEDCTAHDFCDADHDLFRATSCGGEDCDDDDSQIYPGATETPYDGVDDDCDGADLCDLDHDGVDSSEGGCGGDDCNDADAFTYPDAPEIPYDTVDQDCDDADWCDVDGDGFDSIRCDGGDDCDDDVASIHPGATEISNNGIDEDCDGEDDCDADDDGVWNVSCGGEDCDDTDGTINPLADEIPYDGVDQDCDGADVCDADHDGHDAPECGGDDCLDTDPGAYPGALEAPDDGIDQDCNGEDLYALPPAGCDCDTSPAGPAPWSLVAGLGFALALFRRRARAAADTSVRS